MSEQITKDLGGITAYAAAVAAGYTGTKAQFETLMASYATVAQNAAASATAANGSAEDAEAFADGQRDGVDVGSTDPAYHNNAKYYAELAEDFADSIDPDKIESHIDAAYIKETASGSIATFSDGAPAPVRNLVAEIVPVQSGSGDPSPDNVRPITGWTKAEIHVADGENPHIVDNVKTINWQSQAGTVYGGRLDVTSGVLTVDKGYSDMGSLGWDYYNGVFYAGLSMKVGTLGEMSDIDCETYKPIASGYTSQMADETIMQSYEIARVYVKDSAYTTVASFKSAVNGKHFTYPLATPQTYQLTPTEVKSLLKNNNIWADTGDVTVEYVADTKLYIDKKLAEL